MALPTSRYGQRHSSGDRPGQTTGPSPACARWPPGHERFPVLWRRRTNVWREPTRPARRSRATDKRGAAGACLLIAALLDADQSGEESLIRFAGPGLLCLVLSVSGPASAGSCVVPYIRTLDNQTVNGTMYVVSGKHCS